MIIIIITMLTARSVQFSALSNGGGLSQMGRPAGGLLQFHSPSPVVHPKLQRRLRLARPLLPRLGRAISSGRRSPLRRRRRRMNSSREWARWHWLVSECLFALRRPVRPRPIHSSSGLNRGAA